MKLSTKGRYGLRAMMDLAIHSLGDHVSLSSVAERQNISENYLEQVISSLRKSGLVKSIKGVQGGYLIGDKPSRISVGQILRVLEGDFATVDDGSEGGQSGISSMQSCIQQYVWDRLADNIYQFVDSITLEDLLNEHSKMSDSSKLMYYI